MRLRYCVLCFLVCVAPMQPLWAADEKPDVNRTAFFYGTIGTELMPLPVAVTLPVIFPDYFQPRKESGDWIDQFGFIRDSTSPDGLPLGFTKAAKFPKTGQSSPVQFVGLACAVCHTARLHTSYADTGFVVAGTGNPA